MNDLTGSRNDLCYVGIHKKLQISCQGTYPCLLCKLRTFLQNACQRQVLNGQPLELYKS